MSSINANYAQYLHTYEAYRIPKDNKTSNHTNADVLADMLNEEDKDELILTEKAKKQMEKDRQNYNKMLDAESQMAAAKSQAEGEKQQTEEMMKIMKVFQSMARGNIVPPSDEQKLMKYDPDLYQAAKRLQAMAQQAKRKKEKSQWDEKEEAEKRKKLDKLNEESNELAMSIGEKSAAFAEAQKAAIVEVSAPSQAIASYTGSIGEGAVVDASV